MVEDKPETLLLPPGEAMPNNRLPVIIYRGTGGAADFTALFSRNGWRGIWRNGIYDYDHYHSNAHEALGVAAGSAVVRLGGDEGVSVTLRAGDVVVLPAGTGHRRLEQSDDFEVVGAYPPGQTRYDINRTRSIEADLRISRVALPTTDPVHGKHGPLLQLWR